MRVLGIEYERSCMCARGRVGAVMYMCARDIV